MKTRWFQLSSTELQLCLTTDGTTRGLHGREVAQVVVCYGKDETDDQHRERIERIMRDLNVSQEAMDPIA